MNAIGQRQDKISPVITINHLPPAMLNPNWKITSLSGRLKRGEATGSEDELAAAVRRPRTTHYTSWYMVGVLRQTVHVYIACPYT